MKHLLAALFFLLPALPVQAREAPPAEVQTIAAYLNGITTLQARFHQLNQDGSAQDGTFYLWRPGRLRFEYDVPEGADGADYIVADGLLVHYWDHGVKNYSNAPIGSTLADFLLRKKITLSGDLDVVNLERPRDNYLLITLAQADNREAGDVRLLFTENPLQLQKWRVTDGSGSVTEITLSDIRPGIRLDPRLFRFHPPKGYDQDWRNTR